MKAGACPNAKCMEAVNFESIKAFPTKCNQCGERILEHHNQQFKDVMDATRMHLDNMKTSSIACKI